MLNPSIDWQRATPDGLLIRENCSQSFIERHEVEGDEVITVDAKTSMMIADVPRSILDEKWGDEWSDHIPAEYAVQLQQQMMVVDASDDASAFLLKPGQVFDLAAVEAAIHGRRCRRGMLTAWIQGRDAVDYALRAVPSFQAALVERLDDIVTRHLVFGEPMDPTTDEDWQHAAREWVRPRRVEKVSRMADDETGRLVVRGHELKRTIKANESELDEVRARLIKEIGDGYSITTDAYEAQLRGDGERKESMKAPLALQFIDEIPWPPEVRRQIEAAKKRATISYTGGRSLHIVERKLPTEGKRKRKT